MDMPIDDDLRYQAENESSSPNPPTNPPATANISHSLQTLTLLKSESEPDVRFQCDLSRIQVSDSSPEEQTQKLTGPIKTILECIGENLEREGLRDTPKRYAKALLNSPKGYGESLHSVTNGAIFIENYHELVVVKDIDVHIGYIPNGRIIGLSKLPRIVEMFARRLQVQERLTEQIARAVFDLLRPQGVGVVMECSHLCMQMRGVQKVGSSTTTSCMLGCLQTSAIHREEFISALKQ
ncbi:GTP cyclohydrolase I [Penicillium herquei]|nr:GTP cyclohydrolase I [Penicillium herquei]